MYINIRRNLVRVLLRKKNAGRELSCIKTREPPADAEMATQSMPRPETPGIKLYRELGAEPVINAVGSVTFLGASSALPTANAFENILTPS